MSKKSGALCDDDRSSASSKNYNSASSSALSTYKLGNMLLF